MNQESKIDASTDDSWPWEVLEAFEIVINMLVRSSEAHSNLPETHRLLDINLKLLRIPQTSFIMALEGSFNAQNLTVQSVDESDREVNGSSAVAPESTSRLDHTQLDSAESSQDQKQDTTTQFTTPTKSTFENRLRPAQGSTTAFSSHSVQEMKRLRANGDSIDVINRIIWDDRFQSSDYMAVYEDRFLGRLEISLDSWKKDSTDEEFIPLHRIVYIVRKADGEVVWDRRQRLDRIFSSGNSACEELSWYTNS